MNTPKEAATSDAGLAFAIVFLMVLALVTGICIGDKRWKANPCDNGKVSHYVYPIRVRPIPLWVRTNHGRCSGSIPLRRIHNESSSVI